MKEIFENRRNILIQEMQNTNIQAVVFHDDEHHRNPAVRYYTNHPSDAILIITNWNTTYMVCLHDFCSIINTSTWSTRKYFITHTFFYFHFKLPPF